MSTEIDVAKHSQPMSCGFIQYVSNWIGRGLQLESYLNLADLVLSV